MKNQLRPWYLPTEDPAEGVLRRWIRKKCTLRMQAVLIAAVRGCDGAPKDDPSKAILWELRFDCLNPSCQGQIDPFNFDGFMGYKYDVAARRSELLASLDQYPFHFVAHLAHAAEIVGYYHPDKNRRVFWGHFYQSIVFKNFHCNPETQLQLEERLRDR